MNKSIVIRPTFVQTGTSKKEGSDKIWVRLCGVEVSKVSKDYSFGCPVFDYFLTSKLLDVVDYKTIRSWVECKTLVSAEIANFKDESSGQWVNALVGLSPVELE